MSNDVVLKNDGKNRHQSQECHCLIRLDELDNVYGDFTFEVYGYDKQEVLHNLSKLQDSINKDLYAIRKNIKLEIEKDKENVV